jgi:hypothetical protein
MAARVSAGFTGASGLGIDTQLHSRSNLIFKSVFQLKADSTI